MPCAKHCGIEKRSHCTQTLYASDPYDVAYCNCHSLDLDWSGTCKLAAVSRTSVFYPISQIKVRYSSEVNTVLDRRCSKEHSFSDWKTISDSSKKVLKSRR